MVEQLEIEGGAVLGGRVRAAGAKNACLPVLAACLLAPGRAQLANVSGVRDVAVMLEILGELGVGVSTVEAGRLQLDVPAEVATAVPYELVKRMRASIFLLGPLLARRGRASVALPGGCAIGPRPVNLHIDALRQMGADVNVVHGNVEASCERLRGARIRFETVTVGGTENVLMAASLADGTTVIENAAREPEIVDLARCLTGMGAAIQGAGTDTIEIEGRTELAPARHRVIPDRIETGTYAAAAAITGGRLWIEDCAPEHLEAFFDALRAAGCRIEVEPGAVLVEGPPRLRPVDVRTMPYPGFPTDLQAQFTALMCLADGRSRIVETIFENRFMHVAELTRLGAVIDVDDRTALITGVPALEGAPVQATDIRASVALVLAGLVARGTTTVSRLEHLDRGYDRLEEKLRAVGARLRRRVSEEDCA